MGNSVWCLHHIDLFIFMFVSSLHMSFWFSVRSLFYSLCQSRVGSAAFVDPSSCFSLLALAPSTVPWVLCCLLLCFVFGLFGEVFFGNCIWKANYMSNGRSKMKVTCFWKLYTCFCGVLGGTTCLGTSSPKLEIHSHRIMWAWCHLHMHLPRFPASPLVWQSSPSQPCLSGKEGPLVGPPPFDGPGLCFCSCTGSLLKREFKLLGPGPWSLNLCGNWWGFNPEIRI